MRQQEYTVIYIWKNQPLFPNGHAAMKVKSSHETQYISLYKKKFVTKQHDCELLGKSDYKFKIFFLNQNQILKTYEDLKKNNIQYNTIGKLPFLNTNNCSGLCYFLILAGHFKAKLLRTWLWLVMKEIGGSIAACSVIFLSGIMGIMAALATEVVLAISAIFGGIFTSLTWLVYCRLPFQFFDSNSNFNSITNTACHYLMPTQDSWQLNILNFTLLTWITYKFIFDPKNQLVQISACSLTKLASHWLCETTTASNIAILAVSAIANFILSLQLFLKPPIVYFNEIKNFLGLLSAPIGFAMGHIVDSCKGTATVISPTGLLTILRNSQKLAKNSIIEIKRERSEQIPAKRENIFTSHTITRKTSQTNSYFSKPIKKISDVEMALHYQHHKMLRRV